MFTELTQVPEKVYKQINKKWTKITKRNKDLVCCKF